MTRSYRVCFVLVLGSLSFRGEAENPSPIPETTAPVPANHPGPPSNSSGDPGTTVNNGSGEGDDRLKCDYVTNADFNRSFSAFIKDLAQRKDVTNENLHASVERLSKMIALATAESAQDTRNITPMDGNEIKADAVDAYFKDPDSNSNAKVPMDHKTNFGVFQISPDRFALHPMDSLRSLQSVLASPDLDADLNNFNADDKSKYFGRASELYGKVGASVDASSLAAKCGSSDVNAIKELADVMSLLPKYQKDIAKSVSGGAPSKKAALFFGKLLTSCPRLNMEMAFREFKYTEKAGANKSKIYWQPIVESGGAASFAGVCQSEVKRLLVAAMNGVEAPAVAEQAPTAVETPAPTLQERVNEAVAANPETGTWRTDSQNVIPDAQAVDDFSKQGVKPLVEKVNGVMNSGVNDPSQLTDHYADLIRANQKLASEINGLNKDPNFNEQCQKVVDG